MTRVANSEPVACLTSSLLAYLASCSCLLVACWVRLESSAPLDLGEHGTHIYSNCILDHNHNMSPRQQQESEGVLNEFFDRILENFRAENIPQEDCQTLASLRGQLLTVTPVFPQRKQKTLVSNKPFMYLAWSLSTIRYTGNNAIRFCQLNVN